MDGDELHDQAEEGQPLFAPVDLDSGSDDAFMAIHDPIGWLESKGFEVAAGKKVTTTIEGHQHGLKKKNIRVTPSSTSTGDVTLTFTKSPPSGTAPEPIGYRFASEES